MKLKILLICNVVLVFILFSTSVSAQSDKGKGDLKYIDPSIGNAPLLLQPTRPTVHLPNQMVRVFSMRTDYIDDQISSFPLNIVSHRLGEVFSIKPVSGNIVLADWERKFTYDHDLEINRPWYFSTYLVDEDIRRPLVKGRIVANVCDIVGVQEGLGSQIANLETDLPDYARIGVGRDGETNSEHSAIFYRSSRFNLLSSGTFWLSPGAPTTPTGPSWDAAFRRICTWAQFQDKTTSLKFWVFNSHFDHQGTTAQQNSANLILSQMQAKSGVQPAIFMGDLNTNQTAVPYTILNNSSLLEETWNIAGTKAPELRVTGNSWSANPTGNNQIDHIFVTGEWAVSSRLVDWYNQDPGDIVPSDHWPIIAQMKINGVTFYQDANYSGPASQILPVGNYTLAQLQARGMANDWASSVRVPSGRTLIMYDDNNFGGTSWTRTSDTPLFSALSPTANDKVSSVKVQ